MYYVWRIVAVLALLAAGWFSIRLAMADACFRRGTPESVARAVEILPDNTDYLALRALQIEYDGLDSTPLLEHSATLNPLASAPRIRLGLAAEIHGDPDRAEKWLLDAARIDRQFEPRWTLANYYFRRQNTEQFWKWMKAALEISYGDRRPAFDLCWRESSDANEIFTRAIPDGHDVTAAYLTYLVEQHRPDAVLPVALRLAAANDPGDRPLLLSVCDALLDARDGASARALWIKMGFAAPSGIVNGSSGHGFDWRLLEVPGVIHMTLDQPRPGRRIALNGRQPESCELLRQILSLRPGAHYTLHWEARTISGVEWRIANQRGVIPSSGDWRGGQLNFIAPSDLVPVTLAYQRPPGQARAEGVVELSGITIVENK